MDGDNDSEYFTKQVHLREAQKLFWVYAPVGVNALVTAAFVVAIVDATIHLSSNDFEFVMQKNADELTT